MSAKFSRQVSIEGLSGDIRVFTVELMAIIRLKEEINDFSRQRHIEIIWVPVYCGIAVNGMTS